MKLFDCYAMFGELSLGPPRYARNAEELVRVMHSCGIQEALVFHSSMKHESPVTGNQAVIRETRSHPNLHPTWAIVPPQTGEQPPAAEYLAAMRQTG